MVVMKVIIGADHPVAVIHVKDQNILRGTVDREHQ
jgi:hypothetical protein